MSAVYTDAPLAPGNKPHRLYLGSKADAKDFSKLDDWGVTHVVNVTPEKEAGIQSGVPNYFETKPLPGGRIITYRRIPVYDAATSDLLSFADSVVGFISSGLHHGSVLVHCKAGVSRSATCVMFFLMRKLGLTFERALDLCQKCKPDVEPIPAFVLQLQQYEAKCRKLGIIGESNSVAGKKRQRHAMPIIGPNRPVIPTIGPDTRDEKKAKRSVIGPALGPVGDSHVGKSEKERAKAIDDPLEKASSEHTTAEKKQKTTESSLDSSGSCGNENKTKRRLIGPALGPHVAPSSPYPDETN